MASNSCLRINKFSLMYVFRYMVMKVDFKIKRKIGNSLVAMSFDSMRLDVTDNVTFV